MDGYGALFVLALVVIACIGATPLRGHGYLAACLFCILLGNSLNVCKISLVCFFGDVTWASAQTLDICGILLTM